MDQVFDAILRDVIKRWPRFIGSINEFKRLPRNLPLNVFPCYRQTLDLIIKNCFSLPKVNYLFYTSNLLLHMLLRKFTYLPILNFNPTVVNWITV